MSTGGDAALAVAYSQVGVTEQPPNSNQVPYWDWWGCNLGSWCAAFVSWCAAMGGYPLPAIDGSCSGVPGFVSCPSGTVYCWSNGEIPPTPEPGDVLIFSWYPWAIDGGLPIITSGEYAGWVAGDHTGFYVADLGGGYLLTVEGNTSQSSWDNGGAVLERADRYWGQVCALWRPTSWGGPSPAPVPEPEDVPPVRLLLDDPAQSPHGTGTLYAVDGLGQAWALSSADSPGVLKALGLIPQSGPGSIEQPVKVSWQTFGVFLHYIGYWEAGSAPPFYVPPNPVPRK